MVIKIVLIISYYRVSFVGHYQGRIKTLEALVHWENDAFSKFWHSKIIDIHIKIL